MMAELLHLDDCNYWQKAKFSPFISPERVNICIILQDYFVHKIWPTTLKDLVITILGHLPQT